MNREEIEAIAQVLVDAHRVASSDLPFKVTISDVLQAQSNVLLAELIQQVKYLDNSVDGVRSKLSEVETAVIRS